MRIEIRTRGVDITDELRELVRRRTHFAFSRLREQMSRVSLTVSDVNGPRGGVDKMCQVRVVGRFWNVLVRDEHANLATAVGRAISRAGRVAARNHDRALDSSVGKPRRAAR